MDDAGLAPTRHRLTATEYHRMAEAGVFGAEDRIELIDGDLIDMAPIGQGHAAIVNGLTEALFRVCLDRAIVCTQNPIRLDRFNEPQPDLAVLRRRADFYATGERPGPADVLLVIEVADSALRFDRMVKLPLYARAARRTLDRRHAAPDGRRLSSAGRRPLRRDDLARAGQRTHARSRAQNPRAAHPVLRIAARRRQLRRAA